MYPETNTLPKQPYPVRSAAGLVDLPVVMRLLSVLSGSLTISDQNLQDIAEQYLGNKIGLSAEEISALKMKLSKGT
jgi:hypothetical protein